MGTRRKAREYALQMLFQWDITRDQIESIAASFWENHDESEGVVEFAKQLVTRTIEHVEQIDSLIQKHAEHWRLDRMAVVDRNLLRMATHTRIRCRLPGATYGRPGTKNAGCDHQNRAHEV